MIADLAREQSLELTDPRFKPGQSLCGPVRLFERDCYSRRLFIMDNLAENHAVETARGFMLMNGTPKDGSTGEINDWLTLCEIEATAVAWSGHRQMALSTTTQGGQGRSPV